MKVAELNAYKVEYGDIESAVHKARSYGLAIVPNFFSTTETEGLNEELVPFFNSLNPKECGFADGAPLRSTPDSYKPGKALRITPPSYSHFPQLSRLFVGNPFLNAVVDSYYGVPNNKFMQVFAYHDTRLRDEEWIDGVTHSAALHFDPYQALKFGAYLTDTGKENGATRLIPGSHTEGKNFRLTKLKSTLHNGKSVLNCHEPFSHSQYSNDDAVYLEVAAGTLVIFDTDAWHAGSEILESGLERKFIVCHNRRN